MRVKISQIFDYIPGNHGLTEDIIYEYKPISKDEKFPIFSGSKNNIIPIGYIGNNAKNKDGYPIKYFEGPCLILTKDGSAGLITYKSRRDDTFTINHHACILKLKEEWQGIIDLKWFSWQFKRRLYQYVTSKSDNGVFSTKWFDRIVFEIPDYKIQLMQNKKKNKLYDILDWINIYLVFLNTLINTKISEDDFDGERYSLDVIFHFKGGNSGLTKEFVYYNQPTNDNEKIPILSGATLKLNLMGHISRNAKPNKKI